MPRKEPKPIQIDSIKHADESRANIPTNELRDFVADDEHNPQMKLYPRNPDLDPQLVWKGKDEQDNQDLASVGCVRRTLHPRLRLLDWGGENYE